MSGKRYANGRVHALLTGHCLDIDFGSSLRAAKACCEGGGEERMLRRNTKWNKWIAARTKNIGVNIDEEGTYADAHRQGERGHGYR